MKKGIVRFLETVLFSIGHRGPQRNREPQRISYLILFNVAPKLINLCGPLRLLWGPLWAKKTALRNFQTLKHYPAVFTLLFLISFASIPLPTINPGVRGVIAEFYKGKL